MKVDLISIRDEEFVGSNVTGVNLVGKDFAWIKFEDGTRIELTRNQLEQIVAEYHNALGLESFIESVVRRPTLSA